MTRLWSGMGALALVCVLSVPVSAQPGPILCQFFPGLPGCPPPDPTLADRVTALEQENADQQDSIDALLMAVQDLNVTVSQNEMNIAALQMCCDDLQMRVARLEAFTDCPMPNLICLDGMGDAMCVDPMTDDANCGGCAGEGGTVCAMNEQCVDGACELLPCDPINQCNMAMLMMDGTCVQTPLPNTTPCDDGMFCTASDVCQFGTCVGFGTPCMNMTDVCDEMTDMCMMAP